MPENQISRMALWAAYFRAFNAQHASPKVFDDFLAGRFVDALLTEKLAQTRGLAKMLLMNEEERASLGPRMQQALKALERVGPPHLRPFADADAAFAWIMRITTFASLLDPNKRAAMLATANSAIVDVAGGDPLGGLGIWVVIDEIAAGSWGVAGRPIGLAEIQAFNASTFRPPTHRTHG